MPRTGNGVRRNSSIIKFNGVPLYLGDSGLNSETAENKERILDEALQCIFFQIPESIFRLDEFLQDLHSYYRETYDNQKETDVRQQLRQWNAEQTARYPFVVGDAKMIGDQKPEKSKNLDETATNLSECLRHHDGEPHHHICINHYSFIESLNIFPLAKTNANGYLKTNGRLVEFSRRYMANIVTLTEQMFRINLGLGLLFPKSEDNEDADLSLDFITNIISLTAVQKADIHVIHRRRANIIQLVQLHPHAEETAFMLREGDVEATFKLMFEVESLISQCCRLYDSFNKNFDRIVKSKKQCEQTFESSSGATTGNIADSIFS